MDLGAIGQNALVLTARKIGIEFASMNLALIYSKTKLRVVQVDISKIIIISFNVLLVNVWSNWSSCSKSCGKGSRTKTNFCGNSLDIIMDTQTMSCHLDGCKS